MNRLELEDKYGHVCDCRIKDDPPESLCGSCRRIREDQDSDQEGDVHGS